MHGALLAAWARAYRRCRDVGWQDGQHRLMVLMVYFICIWVLAIGEDGLEKPYNIIPYYFFWGLVLRLGYFLERERIGPMADDGESFG